MIDPAAIPPPIEPPVEPPSYANLFGRLLKDGEDFARAKLHVYHRLAVFRASQARAAIALALAGLLLLLAALIVLLTGFMFALVSVVGSFLWSALIVFAACVIIGILLLTLARGALPDFDDSPLDDPISLPEKELP